MIASRSSDFVNHSYDYRPNWTPLGPITIINHNHSNFRKKKQQQQQIHLRKTSPVVKMSNKKFGNFPVFFLRVSGCCHGYCGQFCDWWI